jgi:hypothetical protein
MSQQLAKEQQPLTGIAFAFSGLTFRKVERHLAPPDIGMSQEYFGQYLESLRP